VSLQYSIATLVARGWSGRKIARELGVDRETVRRYRPQPDPKPAIPPTGSQDDSVSKPAIVPTGSKAGRTSQCDPLAEVIAQGLGAGLSAQRIYQDLVTAHQFPGGYDAVKRFVRRLSQRVSGGMKVEENKRFEIPFSSGAFSSTTSH
jgi:IS30 family transposase